MVVSSAGCREGWTADGGMERTDNEEECLLCPLDADLWTVDCSLDPAGEAVEGESDVVNGSGMSSVLETKDA